MKNINFKSTPIRVFLDTNVIIAGIASLTGASNVVLDLCESEIIEMIISKQVLIEADRNFEKKFPSLIQEFRVFIKNISPILVDDPNHKKIKEAQKLINSDDSPILAVALREKVDYFITLDNDFLSIKEKVPIAIVTPAEFLKKFRKSISKE